MQDVLVLRLFVQIPDLSIFSVKMSNFGRFALLGFTECRSVKRDRRTWAFDSSNLPASQGAKCAAQGSEYRLLLH